MFRWLALGLAVLPASAQLPSSATLSEADRPLFRAEIARIEKLLDSASDKSAVSYLMARTWASAKQWPETMAWLQKVIALNAGLDPSRDPMFAELRTAKEFAKVVEAVRKATPPITHSKSAFQIQEGDLAPESVAYDPKGKYFYFGSMTKGKVVRCSASGNCTQFTDGLDTVLGVKVHGDALWLLNNSGKNAALIHYDLSSGKLVHKYAVSGTGHMFNDLAISPKGGIYVTDTRAGAIWYLESSATELTRIPGKFEAANGITLSADGQLLYVSTFPDGITLVDLKTHTSAPLTHPVDLCLGYIDGLYFHQGALVAIQNGFMTPRVVRMTLSGDLRTVERFDILERRNPLFDGVTTGVIVGNELFYMANIQDGKKDGFNPIKILKVGL